MRVSGLNGETVFLRIDLDTRFIQPLLGVGVFNSVYLYFRSVPTENVNRATDIVELNSAIGRNRIGFMKFFRVRAMIGSVRAKRQDESKAGRCETSSNDDRQPQTAVHRLLLRQN